MPGPNTHQPAQVTDPQRPAARPTTRISGYPSTHTSKANAPGPLDPPVGNNDRPSNVGSSDPSQVPPKDSTRVPSGDPAATISEDPRQGDNPKADEPTPIHKPAANSPVANSPAAIPGSSDPNDESVAQISALHQGLEPAPPAGPKAQPTANQPAANQPVSPPVQPGVAVAPERVPPAPVLPASDNPASPNMVSPHTTIQIAPQLKPDSEPTTVYVGSRPHGNQVSPGSGRKITVAGHAVTANAESFNIAGTPIKGGDPDVTISGTVVSLGTSGNLIIAVTAGAAPAQPAIITAGGRSFEAQNTGLAIAGTTVAAGGPTVLLAGTPVILGVSGVLVIGSITTTLAKSPSSIFTVGGQAFTANPTAFAIARTTLSAGGPAVLLSGTPVSLGPSGKLVLGSTTAALANPTQSSIFNIGGQSFTVNPTGFAIAGTTVSAGGPGITIIGTSTSSNPPESLINGMITAPLKDPAHSIFTTDGQTYTIKGDWQVAVAGTTLRLGTPAITIGGVPMSVGSDVLVIGTNTVPLPPTIPTTTVITTDGQVLTVERGGLVAIDGVTPTSGVRETTVSGIPTRVNSDGLIMGTDGVPWPANLSSATSSPSFHAAGTNKPMIGAASYEARAPRGVWCGLLIALTLMYIS